MGRHFGNIKVLKSQQIHFALSPFEQRAFAGFFSKGLPRLMQRVSSTMFRGAPILIACYLIYDWGEKDAIRQLKKQPGQFDNDV